jgi:transposase
MPRPPADWREGRRLRAWELKQAGWSQRAIASALGVSESAVCQWMRRAREGGGVEALRRRPAPGPTPKLSAEQRAQLPALLARGAEAVGFVGEVWTTPRVATHSQQAARGGYPNAAPAGCGWGGGADWHTFLELGQAPRACVCSGYGHVSLLPSGSAAHYRRHHPGRGDPQDSPPSEARGRPAADCPGSCSPSSVRWGRLNPRHRAWPRGGRARSGDHINTSVTSVDSSADCATWAGPLGSTDQLEEPQLLGWENVWSKNACNVARIVFQEPPEPCTTLKGTWTLCVLTDHRKEGGVAKVEIAKNNVFFDQRHRCNGAIT